MSDPRIERGLRRQLELRSSLLSAGHGPLGWKAGFGAASALEKFALGGPLVGFMTSASLIDHDSIVDIKGWERPMAEPELAVWFGEDVAPEGDEQEIRSAIHSLGPAIELADLNPPPEDVEEILASNIFHRGVVLGEADTARRGGDLTGLEAGVRLDGEPVRTPADLEEPTGRITEVVSHLSSLLAGHDEAIRAGEVVICGSITPPLSLSPGSTMVFELAPFSPITLRTA